MLGTEGRLIQRVTEILREVSARRGHVLSRDFARTLAEAKWQSIVLGCMGVLIGLFAAALVVRRTVRPLARIANSDPRGLGRREGRRDPGDRRRQRDRRHRAGGGGVPLDLDRCGCGARGSAVRALAEQRKAEESYRKLFETSVDGIYVTTPGRRPA